MVRKYANPHSCRYRIWQKIGPVPHNLVHKSCSHLLMDIASFGRFDGLSCIISINNGGDSNSIISETEDENINTEIY